MSDNLSRWFSPTEFKHVEVENYKVTKEVNSKRKIQRKIMALMTHTTHFSATFPNSFSDPQATYGVTSQEKRNTIPL